MKANDVNLFVKDNEMRKKPQTFSKKHKLTWKVHFFRFDYADVWFRDYGSNIPGERDNGIWRWCIGSSTLGEKNTKNSSKTNKFPDN